MARRILILSILLMAQLVWAQKQKFQVNGAARAYYFVNDLKIDDALDSITVRKANYGHTLLDFGLSLFPNQQTEVIGMFRIRNDLGGFWGGGVRFDVRQVSLKGVAGNILRYELGDIDLSMTPYTLFNFSEEGQVNEADLFALRRDVVHYDLFYTDNNWRMQGGQAQFGLKSNKIIKGVDFRGFLTRQRPTNGIDLPERLFGGGSMLIRQSKSLAFGLQSVNAFDLKGTIPDSIQFKNHVHTANLEYSRKLGEKLQMGLSAEAGISDVQYLNYREPNAPEPTEEWFYDAAVKFSYQPAKLEAKLGYKDVGADFLSAGAQTRRMNFAKFPGLYRQIGNNAAGRPVSFMDFYNGSSENSVRISEQLLAYSPAYNNISPYGQATPNRRGLYLNLEREDSAKFRHSFINLAMVQQSRGTGTLLKKQFMVVEAGTDIYLSDFLGWKKVAKLDLGLRMEQTKRGGEVYEAIDLGSTFADLGLSVEFVQQLSLLLGAKYLKAKGNEFLEQRNRYNTIENFTPTTFDFDEKVLAGGLSYAFGNGSHLTAQYQNFQIRHRDQNGIDYGIPQFTVLFNLAF